MESCAVLEALALEEAEEDFRQSFATCPELPQKRQRFLSRWCCIVPYWLWAGILHISSSSPSFQSYRWHIKLYYVAGTSIWVRFGESPNEEMGATGTIVEVVNNKGATQESGFIYRACILGHKRSSYLSSTFYTHIFGLPSLDKASLTTLQLASLTQPTPLHPCTPTAGNLLGPTSVCPHAPA